MSNDQRFWVCDEPPDYKPFGDDTDGIVDETQGGIILYCHRLNTSSILSALRAADER